MPFLFQSLAIIMALSELCSGSSIMYTASGSWSNPCSLSPCGQQPSYAASTTAAYNWPTTTAAPSNPCPSTYSPCSSATTMMWQTSSTMPYWPEMTTASQYMPTMKPNVQCKTYPVRELDMHRVRSNSFHFFC
jgi:hypothetical protein